MKIKGQTAKKGGGGEPVHKALKQPLSPLEIKTSFRLSVNKVIIFGWMYWNVNGNMATLGKAIKMLFSNSRARNRIKAVAKPMFLKE